VADWSSFRLASDAALDRAARITKADKARILELAKADASPKLRAMLEAEPVKPKRKKR
jgi:hypothetical protein